MAAVAVASSYGGFGPGLLAALLGGLAIDYFFEEPLGSFAITSLNTVLNVLVFLLVAVLVGAVNARVRAARERSAVDHAELAGVLDATDDSVVAYAADGRITRMNRHARARYEAGWGAVPTTLDEVADLVGTIEGLDGSPTDVLPEHEALSGRPSAALLAHRHGDRTRRFFVRAVPLPDEAGGVRGAVAVWRDVTELNAAVTAVARLDGAVKTARRVTHEMGNALAPALGYGELLPSTPLDQATRLVAEITRSVDRAAGTLEQLRRIERYAEVELGGDRMLDLDAAARRRAPTGPAAPGTDGTAA
jgi:two-component system sensor histidine kinase KdpD